MTGNLSVKSSNDPWGFQADLDTPKSFEAFVFYRDMGGDRNLPAVAKNYGKSLSLVQRWSSEGNWSERAEAYHCFLDETSRDTALKINIESHIEKIRRYRQMHETLGWQALNQASDCLQIVTKALENYKENPPLEMKTQDIKNISTAGFSAAEIGSKLLADALAINRLLESLPIDLDSESSNVDEDFQ